MKLSVIIVTFNSAATIERCLRSVWKEVGEGAEVFVVDNASSDGTVGIVKKFPKVKLIQNPVNRGFAAANNQAIRKARGSYILLLNPDTQVKPGSLEKLITFSEKHPQVGIVSPKLLNPDGSVQREVRQFPTLLPMIMRLFKADRAFPFLKRTWPLKEFLMEDFDYDRTQEIPHLMGAVLLVKREVFETVGFYDENFFLWLEDTDFCLRAKEAGWGIVYYPEAEITHLMSHTVRRLSPWEIQRRWNDSLRYYFKKHQPFMEQLLLEPFLWASLVLMPPAMFFIRLLRYFKKGGAGN